ncbi:MogA/MoaB family molybdenum cofactor biosynthesis protein [Pseudoneobacillus rhizosphaerae]|uniref:Molybdenum cofactor biosynthesis protein B n=1 Tax=Pseudoneobacillus rhizosphaerae TaxID=2880968 RepID=A0A9C7LBG3_9BACI|nr:MogA/MoaB family molybdenum cofactor biosynthesis protein [Pseudoneobacillus rhizosphaerae]CAG9608898.1 Molybdenum cofactor biosynthesis protein B [Pseudoneobacillus rhizosphaerae]
MSLQEHKKTAVLQTKCKVITVSDTRNVETDKSGQLMKELLENSGHQVVDYVIVKDEGEAIRAEVIKGCTDERIDVVLTNGGTGIAKRDVTIETVKQLFEKEISGFGELFRLLSYQEDIGSAAILSRAIAGVYNDTAVFSTPGSTGAVRLAMNKLILPELGHVVKELKKDL